MQPFVDGLLVTAADGTPRLLAGKRRSDGRIRFPLPQGPEAAFYEPYALATEGTLWSYTVQRFRPKSPPYAAADEASFKPYAVGYIELPNEVIVESRIETDDFKALRIGMPMHFVPAVFKAADGREGLIPVFRPAA